MSRIAMPRYQHNIVRTRDESLGSRRRFLAALTVMTASFCVPTVVVDAAEQNDRVAIAVSAERDLMRVRMEMDVKGNVNVPSDSLISRKSELTLPIESTAVLDYEERYRRPIDADPSSEITAIERYYHEAHSTRKLNRSASDFRLRESVRHTHVRRDSLPETIYAVDDYFTHEELGLLRVPVSSVAVDQLLPRDTVAVGDKHRPSCATLASVLNLTSVETSTVSMRVMDIDAAKVKFELSGKVVGSVEGVPTSLHTVGKLTFDRRIGTTTWLAMAVHETREIGKAEPGFDVAATIKMVRQPMPKTVALPVTPDAMAIETEIPQDRLYIDLQSDKVAVSAIMDRRWRMMADLSGNAMMRMIENDRSIAQCNLRPLARLEPGKQWTLEAFQADVRRTLGKELDDLVEADQRVSASGLRVLRIAAHGRVEGVPIQWIMLHFSDDSGRRVLATFTMSSDSSEAFVGADVQLADSLRLLQTDDAATSQTTANRSDNAEIGGADAQVANASRDRNSSDLRDNEVQSASDVR
ncbi:MAG: hypothetical protein HKN47_19200 [Pirellulaceae bacterium]|nr:hypothetical protein [Pirellulaceae bacterium]